MILAYILTCLLAGPLLRNQPTYLLTYLLAALLLYYYLTYLITYLLALSCNAVILTN